MGNEADHGSTRSNRKFISTTRIGTHTQRETHIHIQTHTYKIFELNLKKNGKKIIDKIIHNYK